MEVNYDYLRKVQLQERRSASLCPLEEDFYEKSTGFMEGLKSGLARGIEQAKALDNSESVLNEVFQARKRKILFKAFSDAKNDSFGDAGMAREEKQLYKDLFKIFREYDAVSLERKRGDEGKNSIEVEFLMDLPEFVGLDSRSYGPYSTGQKAGLGAAQADLLVKRGAAKKVTK